MTDDIFINGDYHTHTVFSHGKGSVAENVAAAQKKGLTSLAVTDHGYAHLLVGLSKKGFAAQQTAVAEARKLFPDMEILLGVEANLRGIDGQIDVSDEMADKLDVLLVGFHKPVLGAKLSDNFGIFANAYKKYFVKPTRKMIDRNTEAYVNAIKNNPIDVITHINYHLRVDAAAVAKAAAEYGTYIELSSRHLQCSDDDIKAMLDTDCLFIINSDAHKPSDVGVWDKASAAVKRLSIPAERIVNANGSKPRFRLAALKRAKNGEVK